MAIHCTVVWGLIAQCSCSSSIMMLSGFTKYMRSRYQTHTLRRGPRTFMESKLQGCGSVFIFSGSGSGSRVWCWRPIRIRIRIQGFNDQKFEKNYSWKFLYIFFWSKTAIYLSLGLHKVCPSYRRRLQFSKEAIQHFKTWTLTNYCLLLWVIFALLDPDPDPDSEYGSGSTDPIEYGSGSGSTTLVYWVLTRYMKKKCFSAFQLISKSKSF